MCITVRGTYLPPSKKRALAAAANATAAGTATGLAALQGTSASTPDQERPLYLYVEANRELNIEAAKRELVRLIKEELLRQVHSPTPPRPYPTLPTHTQPYQPIPSPILPFLPLPNTILPFLPLPYNALSSHFSSPGPCRSFIHFQTLPIGIMVVARIFPVSGEEDFSKILKNVLRKSRKMHYFSIFFKKFNKPCVKFLRVWTKNTSWKF